MSRAPESTALLAEYEATKAKSPELVRIFDEFGDAGRCLATIIGIA